jgi:hypothetical protein
MIQRPLAPADMSQMALGVRRERAPFRSRKSQNGRGRPFKCGGLYLATKREFPTRLFGRPLKGRRFIYTGISNSGGGGGGVGAF